MKYYVESSLTDFPFWGGGKYTADALSKDELEIIERLLEEMETEEGWSDTAINDFFWFERETIAEHLGYRDVDAMFNNDDETWEEHYRSVLEENYPNADPDEIDKFIEEELFDNENDKDIVNRFATWLDDQDEEDEDEEN